MLIILAGCRALPLLSDTPSGPPVVVISMPATDQVSFTVVDHMGWGLADCRFSGCGAKRLILSKSGMQYETILIKKIIGYGPVKI